MEGWYLARYPHESFLITISSMNAAMQLVQERGLVAVKPVDKGFLSMVTLNKSLTRVRKFV